MAELAESIRSAVGRPFWEPGTQFAKFYRDFQDHLALKDLSEALLATELGLEPLTGAPLKKASVKVFAILRQAIPEGLYNTIEAKCVAADAVSEDKDGTLCITGAKGNNPPLLWSEILVHSHGSLPALAGQELRRDIRTWVFPADPNKSQVALVDLAIAAQTKLVQRAALLKDDSCPHSQAQACSDARADLPPMLKPNSRAHRAFVTPPTLRLEMLQGAQELDAKPEMLAMVAAITSGRIPSALLAAVASGQPITPALLATGNGGGGGGGARGGGNDGGGGGHRKQRVYVSRERRMGQAAGPPWDGAVFCVIHGWCGHTDSKCNKQIPGSGTTATPALAAAPTSGRPLFERLPNGDFQRVLVAQTKCSPETVLLTPAGLPPTYVDCGGPVSLVFSVNSHGCIPNTYRKFPTPVVVGGVGSGIVAHGEVLRCHAIPVNDDGKTMVLTYYTNVAPASNYEIIATNKTGLGGAGISSKQDAEGLPDMPVILEVPKALLNEPGAPPTLTCKPFNGLWILPEVVYAGPPPPRGRATLVTVAPALAAVPIGGLIAAPKSGVPQTANSIGDVITVSSAPSPVPIGGVVSQASPPTPGVPVDAPIGGADSAGPTIDIAIPVGGIVSHTALLSASADIPVGGIVSRTAAPTAGADVAPPPPAPTTAAVDLTCRFSSLAGRYGASHPLAAVLAPRLGLKLSHKTAPDAVAYNDMVQRVNQTATPVSEVDGTASLPAGHLAFGGDTLGGIWPISFDGNQFALVFMDHSEGKRDPSVSVFNSHYSGNSCKALADWISTSGFPLKLDSTLQPNIHCYVDNGTELRGEFTTLLDANGAQAHRATAHKHNTARTSIIENMNRQLQHTMRINLGNAADAIRSFGLSPTQFWGYALQYAARQIKARNAAKSIDHADATACKVGRAVAKRLVPFALGQRVSQTLQLGSPHRSATGKDGYNKQLADRSAPTLFLGVVPWCRP